MLFHVAENQIVFLESTSPIRCFEKENSQIDPSAGKKLPHHMTSGSGCSSSMFEIYLLAICVGRWIVMSVEVVVEEW